MVFIWVDQGIREPYVPRIPHIPLRKTSSTQESKSSEKVDIHEEKKPPGSYEYKHALDSYTESFAEQKKQFQKIHYAREIMSSPVITVFENDLVGEAEKIFQDKRYRHIPVLNEQKQLVGIISDRDILQLQLKYKEYADLLVREIMKKKILTSPPEMDIREIARVLLEERIGAMIILTTTGELAGLITRTDVLRAVVNRAPLELWG